MPPAVHPTTPPGTQRLPETLLALKALSDPTRLRLVLLLSQGELTVGELCRVLGQSQPRVSRHLRLLSEAGVLDRFRELQCIYYRTPASGPRPAWLAGLLARLDTGEGALRRDRTRRASVMAERVHASGTPDDTDRRELATALQAELGTDSCGALLAVGTGCGRVLELLGRRATHAIGIDSSPPALRQARSRVHSLGLAHCEFRSGDLYALAYPAASFDMVSISGVLASATHPVAALAEAARVLRTGGRLLVLECTDTAHAQRAEPLARALPQWIAAAGLQLQSMRECALCCGPALIALAQHERRPQSPAHAPEHS